MTNKQLHNLKKKWLLEGYKKAMKENFNVDDFRVGDYIVYINDDGEKTLGVLLGADVDEREGGFTGIEIIDEFGNRDYTYNVDSIELIDEDDVPSSSLKRLQRVRDNI